MAVTSLLVRPTVSLSSVYASNLTLFWEILPLWCTPAFRGILFMTKLKRSHDKGSRCLKTLHGIKRFGEVHSCINCSTSFCIALSASQIYRAQTLLQKRDPLWGYRRLPYSRQKDGVCWLVFHGPFPRFGVVWRSWPWWTCQVWSRTDKVQSVFWRLASVVHTIHLKESYMR